MILSIYSPLIQPIRHLLSNLSITVIFKEMKKSLLRQIFRSMMIPGFHVAITINPFVLLFDIHASQPPSICITMCDRKCEEKMLLFEFKSKDISNPRYFHYQYLHGNSAGHHIKPNLSHMLRLCYRCCNSCNDYNCSSNAANQIRDANKREYSRCAASVNRVLNRLV